jgi:serine protease AprX
MRRLPLVLACSVAALAAALSGSAGASNSLSFGNNVDPSLVSTINGASASQNNTNGQYHVLVFGGPGLNAQGSSYGGWRNQLAGQGAYSATLTPAQIAQLSTSKDVQYVAPDVPMAPTGKLSSGISAAQLATFYPQIDGATGLWQNGVTGSGVGIAVIDSGVTPRADFGSRLVQVQLPTQDGTQLNDSVGHGSVVAGVAAGQSADGKYIGIAPGATVYAINVARADGVYTSDVIAGLNWVLQNAKQDNIDVVNLSLSQTTPSSYFTNALDAAVDQLWRAGIVVVASSGNFGADSEKFAPANDPWVITVGASDTHDTLDTSDDTLADFSSYGLTLDGFSKPEIVAPGRHIVGPIPGSSTIAQSAPPDHLVGSGQDNYVKISGTSFSAPQVAGAAALLLQLKKNLSPDQVKWVLTQSERALPGSAAGALDLSAIANNAAHPGNANGGVHWSNFAHAGENTNDFLNALGYNQAQQDMLNAAAKDVQAQTSCLKAAAAAAAALLKPKSPVPAGPYGDCAHHLEDAAATWDKAANEWAAAGRPQNASPAEKSAATDWQNAAAAWTKAGNPANASADASTASAAWDHAATWDSAAWDSAAWDSAAWDRSAAWDSAAWDKAATWDHSAAWDSAAWDSAAWDSAAWDSAAWD